MSKKCADQNVSTDFIGGVFYQVNHPDYKNFLRHMCPGKEVSILSLGPLQKSKLDRVCEDEIRIAESGLQPVVL